MENHINTDLRLNQYAVNRRGLWARMMKNPETSTGSQRAKNQDSKYQRQERQKEEGEGLA
jgi:hypothetical protein